MSKRYKYKSYAKINIGLKVVNKRCDGYHNLESVFQEITLFDEIYFRKTKKDIVIKSNYPSIPVDKRNLCYQSFKLMQEKFSLNTGIEIEIIKNIPIGAGLGGGSSNAATCLIAINEIFNLNLSQTELLVLASKIGSDVPFFILGGTALVKGRGEVVIPIQFLDNYNILIIYPNFSISTSKIYGNFELNLTENMPHVKFEAVISRINNLGDLSEYFYNDLEEIAVALYPELLDVRRSLILTEANFVSMSGSGSAIYGLYRKGMDFRNISINLHKDWKVLYAEPLK
jgi:4-diphosphocytidyl-2-C-methyl-D-erythritol kinase